jgi:uncharacterized protein with PIN domain
MCKNNSLKKINSKDLIIELQSRGYLLNSESTYKVLEEIKNNNTEFNIILTFGYPEKKLECRECFKNMDSTNFSFYLSRVDKNGFLMRSNALCNECSTESNKKRKKVFETSVIPPKPKNGSICPNCDRSWSGNWHRHHEGDKFIEWLCGHCNMSFSDQRNISII